MALFEQLIHQLNPYEQESFRTFIARRKKKNLELKLFDFVVKNGKCIPAEAMQHLYGKINREAYKGTQQRLTRKLTDFTLQLSTDSSEGESDVFEELKISRRLLKRQCWEAAAYFLKSAGEVAENGRQYELLNAVYCLQGRHAIALNLDPEEVERLRLANLERCDRWCRLDLSFSRLSIRHREARKDGLVLDLENTVTEALSDCRPSKAEANDPVFMLRLVQLIRNIATSNKAYLQFERIVIRIYNGLKKKGTFTPANTEQEFEFLYMIAHAQFRNARFDAAMSTLDQATELKSALVVFPVTTMRKLIALRASILNGTGRVGEAIPLLEQALADRRPHESDRELLNMQLSLAAYLYNAREYKRAMKVMTGFPYDVHTLGRLMGTEWRFKLEMFQLISYYDRGLFDESQAQLKRICTFYAEFFREDQYARVQVYLGFVEKMIRDPNIVTTESFREEFRAAQLNRNNEEEDIQAIAFHCWVSSKIFSRDYYEVLLYALNWKTGEVEKVETCNI